MWIVLNNYECLSNFTLLEIVFFLLKSVVVFEVAKENIVL